MICIHDGADLDYVTAPNGRKIPIFCKIQQMCTFVPLGVNGRG